MTETRDTPFPCAVYRREVSNAPYRFSHFCDTRVAKLLPRSLRVSDLRSHRPGENWSGRSRLERAPFLVLVAGDRAHAVSLASRQDSRVPFLYPGSQYCTPSRTPTHSEEIEPAYLHLQFYSTMACYRGGALGNLVPFESMFMLLPRLILDKDLPVYCQRAEGHIKKAFRDSVWVTEGASYHEQSLSMRQPVCKRERPEDAPPGPHAKRVRAALS